MATKLSLFLISALFSIKSHCYESLQAASNWRTLEIKKLQTENAPQIMNIFNAYPETFGHLQADKFGKIMVEIHSMVWVGKSICQSGDPRLVKHKISYDLELKKDSDGNSAGGAVKKAGPLPNQDPCL